MGTFERIPGFEAGSHDGYLSLASTRDVLEEIMAKYAGTEIAITDVEADIKSMIEQESKREGSDKNRIHDLEQVLRLIDARELM